MAGTGGTSCCVACSRALVDNCDSEACLNLSRLNLAVFGVEACIGGDDGLLSWSASPSV